MTEIKQSALLPYTTAEMFDLVNDLEHYADFLPWCSGTTVHKRSKEEVEASIHIIKSGFKHSFTTRNRLQENTKIEVHLLEGPFRHLQGAWHFEAIGSQACKISFNLEFEFLNKFLAATITPIIQNAASKFIDAFCKRAKIIYAK